MCLFRVIVMFYVADGWLFILL